MRARLALAAATAAAGALALGGCGAGTPVDQRRAVGSVHALDISGGVDVRVVRAASPSVTVHAGRAVVDRVITEARDGVLRIHVRHGIVIGADPLRHVRMRVALPRLDDVEVSGGDDVTISGVDSESLRLRVHGAGDVTATGRVDRLHAEISGVGEAHLAGLRARTARVALTGAGDVQLDVTDALDVRVRGAGDVTYRGNPRLTQDVRGPADIKRVGP